MPIDEQAKTGGYVYIMTNPAMPGLVKIGSTKLMPEKRAHELSKSTAVPHPFQVEASHLFDDELRAERELGSALAQYRVNSSREFYACQERAVEALTKLASGITLANVSPTLRQRDKAMNINTNASALAPSYWGRFDEFRMEKNLLPRFENAGPFFFHRYFLVRPSKQNRGRNIHYEGRIRINSPQVSMRVIFKTAPDIKELFDIVACYKREIEQAIGFSLQWIRDRGRKESHIATKRDDMDPRNFGEWDRQHAWLSEIVSGFEAVLRPQIAKLPS
jgi:hypothetical protein